MSHLPFFLLIIGLRALFQHRQHISSQRSSQPYLLIYNPSVQLSTTNLVGHLHSSTPRRSPIQIPRRILGGMHALSISPLERTFMVFCIKGCRNYLVPTPPRKANNSCIRHSTIITWHGSGGAVLAVVERTPSRPPKRVSWRGNRHHL